MFAVLDCTPAVKWVLLRSVAIEDNMPAPVHLVNRHCYCTTWFKAGAASVGIISKYGNVDSLSKTLEAICKYKLAKSHATLKITTGFGGLLNIIMCYLTIRPFALKGYGSITHSASPHGLLTRGP